MATLVLSALSMRARLLTPTISQNRGQSVTTYTEASTPIRLFLSFTKVQANQTDITPSTPRQRNATIYTAPGELTVGQVIRMTRPEVGTFRIENITTQLDNFVASHDECEAVQVSNVVGELVP